MAETSKIIYIPHLQSSTLSVGSCPRCCPISALASQPPAVLSPPSLLHTVTWEIFLKSKHVMMPDSI